MEENTLLKKLLEWAVRSGGKQELQQILDQGVQISDAQYAHIKGSFLIDKDPKRAVALFEHSAQTYEKEGNVVGAYGVYRSIVMRKPDHIPAWFSLIKLVKKHELDKRALISEIEQAYQEKLIPQEAYHDFMQMLNLV